MSRYLKNLGWALLYTILFAAIQFGVTFLAAIVYVIWEITADHIPLQSVGGLVLPVILSHAVFLNIVANIIIIVVAGIIVKSKRKRFRRTLHIETAPPSSFVIPLLMAFLYSAAANILFNVVTLPEFLQAGSQNISMQLESSNLILSLIAVLLVAPVAEEIVFRGILMTKLRTSFSSAMTVFLSALFFSLVHLITGSILIVLFTFIGGLICALVYEKTGSLTVAIAAHIFLNVGGLVTGLSGSLPTVAKYIIVGVGLAAALLLFVVLARKPSKLKINIYTN